MNEEFLTEKERKMFARWHNEGLLDMEKSRMRETLREYVRSTPEKTALKNNFLLWSLFSYRRASAYVLLTVAVIGSGWGIARASEQSLPGEALYTFKTEWSEPVRAAFYLTPQAKKSWQESRIEARLDEAKRLATQKELSDEDIEKIEALITKHQALLTRYAQESNDDQKSEGYPEKMNIEIKSDGEVRYRGHESEKDEIEDSSDENTNRDRSSGSEKEKKSTLELEEEDEEGREENLQKKSSKESGKKKSSIDSKKSAKKESKESEEKKEEDESETDSSEDRSDSGDTDDEDDEVQEEKDDEDEENVDD